MIIQPKADFTSVLKFSRIMRILYGQS
ncbi:Uncharacterized protein HZ326_29202, partial [Fusarium oxysporum f. sp. albedinis]